MIYHQIVKGSTDKSVTIRIVDNNDAKGTPEEAVEHNTSGIAIWYRRDGAAKTAISLAALSALTDAHSDGGIEHIDDGYYRLDAPDAAFASGVDKVVIGGTVTGMLIIGAMVDLIDAVDTDGSNRILAALDDVTNDGKTALEASGLALEASVTTASSHAEAAATSAASADGKLDVIDPLVDAIKAKTDSLTFTVANRVDANTTHINETEVAGVGTSGNKWRGA